MSGQYTHLYFIRHTPNKLLGRYFDSNGIDLEVDFEDSDLKGKAIFQAVIDLPEELQAGVEADFQAVNAMACEGGVIVLMDEANFHDDGAFAVGIAAIDGFHAKAMC